MELDGDLRKKMTKKERPYFEMNRCRGTKHLIESL